MNTPINGVVIDNASDIRPVINVDNKGYWENEMNIRTKPLWTHLSLAVQQEPMEILARSRKGEYMVCFFVSIS
jgi:hypothetical protein